MREVGFKRSKPRYGTKRLMLFGTPVTLHQAEQRRGPSYSASLENSYAFPSASIGDKRRGLQSRLATGLFQALFDALATPATRMASASVVEAGPLTQ